jgi:hypothetical protein
MVLPNLGTTLFLASTRFLLLVKRAVNRLEKG